MARYTSVGSLPGRTVTRNHKVLVQTDAGTGLVSLEDAVTAVGAVSSIIDSDSAFTVAGGLTSQKIKDKLGEIISVKDFGAKGTDTGDDADAIRAADAVVAALGGGELFFPPGIYPLASTVCPSSNVTWRGAGASASILKIPTGNSTKNALIFSISAATPRTNVTIEDLGFEGRWQDYHTQVADNGLITLKYVTNLTVRNCALRNSRAFGFNINECENVIIDGCLLEYISRDGIGVWGSPRVRITNNVIKHNDDDGISVNWETAGSNPVRSQIIITGNHMEDTGPIRFQSPHNAIVANNVIERPVGMGIFIGVSNVSRADIASGHNVLVANNVITDVIDRSWFLNDSVGSINNRRYIMIETLKPQAGSLAVAPGEVDPATGTVQSPYDWNYFRANANTGVGSIRAPHGFVVRGNTCMRTLPAVAKYSDWGYGQAFTYNGMVDYAVLEPILHCCGIIAKVPQTDLLIEDNFIQTGYLGVWFQLGTSVTLADRLLKNVTIRRNTFKDFVFGITWDPTTVSHQELTIDDNLFDGDPYFASTSRGSNGTWAGGGVVALNLHHFAGVVARRNTFQNVAIVYSQTGVSDQQVYYDNLIVCDPDVVDFSVTNKGVGQIPPIADGASFWLNIKDCDPTSATYGQGMGFLPRNVPAMPTSGKWFAGMRVQNRGTGVSGSSILIEWRRLTTGTGHVLATDWRPVYGSITP